MHDGLDIAALLIALPGLALTASGLAALVRRRPLRFALSTPTGLLLVAAGALLGTVGVSRRCWTWSTARRPTSWPIAMPSSKCG